MDIDEDVRGSQGTRRWLAWASAGLLVAGVVSAGMVGGSGRGADQRVVAAAGSSVDGVEVLVPQAAPVAPPPPLTTPPPPPTTLVATTSTKPPATIPPVATTAPPARSAPTSAPTTVTTTTPTTAASPGRATVTVANEAAHAFVVTLNDRVFQLAPGTDSGAVSMELRADGNDTVQVVAVADPSCGTGDADNYFDAGGRYRFTVVASRGMCQSMPGPDFKVTPA